MRLPMALHLPRPPQHHIIVPPPTSTGTGTPRRRWEKGSTPKKTHPPTTCTAPCSKHWQTRASKQLPPVINYHHHSRFLIQWLYLRHRFLWAYLSQRQPPETHSTIQPPQFSVNFIEQLTGALSTILNYELLDFSAANAHLDEAIDAIQFTHDDDNSSSHSHSPSPQSLITSNQHEMSLNNLGTSANQVPHIIDVCALMPPTPIHLHDGVDTGNPSNSPTNVSSAFHKYDHLPSPAPTTERQSEHNRTFTNPSFSSSLPMDSSHGCGTSLPSNNEPHTTLQPHEFMSNNKKEKQQKNGLTISTPRMPKASGVTQGTQMATSLLTSL